jgi:hypothetical protein
MCQQFTFEQPTCHNLRARPAITATVLAIGAPRPTLSFGPRPLAGSRVSTAVPDRRAASQASRSHVMVVDGPCPPSYTASR